MPALLPTFALLLSLSMSEQVSPGELSPFLRVIANSAGCPGRIACRDIDEAMQLKKDGLSPDAKAPVAWAANPAQIKAYLAEGKPVVLIDTRNAAASGVALSDALMKIARHI